MTHGDSTYHGNVVLREAVVRGWCALSDEGRAFLREHATEADPALRR